MGLERPGRDTPFRVLFMGDFSGRTQRGGGEFAKPRRVDRDDIERVLAQLAPQVELAAPDGGAPLALTFSEIEDFHPDKLVLRVDSLRRLRDLRSRLRDDATFADAAAELEQILGPVAEAPQTESATDEPPPEGARNPDGSTVTAADLFGASLDATVQQQTSGEQDWDRVVRDLVAPHMEGIRRSKQTPEQAELVASVVDAMGTQLRRILHDPAFQALEAAWRSLDALVRRIESDSQLQLFVMDVSKAEIAADLSSSKDLRDTRLYRLLVEPTVETEGGEPWAAFIGDYAFDTVPADVLLLSKVGRLAQAAGAAFVGGARPGVVNCPGLGAAPHPSDWTATGDPVGHETWKAIRRTPAIAHIALTWPRYLVRMPYGAQHDATEDVPFEEFPGDPVHEQYLWGNSAYIAAEALANGFTDSGWDLAPGRTYDRDRLPTHVYDDQGEQTLKPCGEALLNERAAEAVLDAGLVPVISVRGEATVRLGRLHSLAAQDVPLAGPWAR